MCVFNENVLRLVTLATFKVVVSSEFRFCHVYVCIRSENVRTVFFLHKVKKKECIKYNFLTYEKNERGQLDYEFFYDALLKPGSIQPNFADKSMRYRGSEQTHAYSGGAALLKDVGAISHGVRVQ